MVQLPEVHPITVRLTECSPRVQNPGAKLRGTRDNTVRLGYVEPARVPLLHAVPSPPQLPDSLHRLAREQSRRPLDFLSGHAYQDEKLEHRGDFTQERRILFSGFVVRMEDTRQPKCMMFGELAVGAGCVRGQEKEWMECFLDNLGASSMNVDQRTMIVTQDEGDWRRRTAEQGANRFMANGSLQTKPGLDYGMQSYAQT